MKPSTSFTRLAVGLTAMASLAVAWPTWLNDIGHGLVERQDTTTSPRPTNKPTSTGSSKPGQVDLNTASLDPDKPTPTGKSNSTKTGHEEFDPTDPAGSIVMVTPAAIAATPALYRVGDFVTWEWNYTNVLADPTAIDLILSCSQVTQTWVLTANMSFESVGKYTWDSNVQATNVQSPLLTEKYTLIIKDSDTEVTATPEPGYLAPNSQFQFAMYTPKPYQPLDSWNCATCNINAGLSDTERRALGFAIGMSIVTVLSFTWFVSGLRI